MDRPKVISPDTLRGGPAERTPPGHVLTTKWPVLYHGRIPAVDPRSPDWHLRIFGLVDEPYDLTYDEIRAMPAVDVVCDMHCVTHWSHRAWHAKASVQRTVLVLHTRGCHDEPSSNVLQKSGKPAVGERRH